MQVRYSRTTQFIDGELRQASSNSIIEIVSPTTEHVIGAAPDADRADVDRAVAAARRSFDSGTWSRGPLQDRLAILEAAVQLFEVRAEEIGQMTTSQMGMPLTFAQMSPGRAATNARHLMELAEAIDMNDLRVGSNSALVVREPVGVVAAIAPWNGPFGLAVTKIMPALIAGCSVVFKPAPETPLEAYVLVEALGEAGVPAGVINLITGGREAGGMLVAHPDVDKVSFTGSTAAGRLIGAECGRRFKRMQLELGGKSAAIILDDADLSAAMPGLAAGCFFNSGQVCASYSRVLAPRDRYDEVIDTLRAAATSYVIGDPFDRATTLGPLVSERQRSRVESYVARGLEQGATLALGGGRPSELQRGWFVEPTIFAGVENTMTIAREEIFGPVISVIAYDGIEEAISIANDSDYGLHGAVFTRDDDRAIDVARRVRTGTFSVNGFVYNQEAPFGGVKCSGVGRDTAIEGLSSYFELKTINLSPSLSDRFGATGSNAT